MLIMTWGPTGTTVTERIDERVTFRRNGTMIDVRRGDKWLFGLDDRGLEAALKLPHGEATPGIMEHDREERATIPAQPGPMTDSRFDSRFTALDTVLSALLSRVNQMDAAVQAALDALQTELARSQALEVANKTLLEGLTAKLAAAGDVAPIAAAVTSKTAELKATNDATAADITANTPA